MAATIISALLIALVTVGVAGFNPLKADNRNLGIMLKGDMRDLGVMVGQQIEMVRLDNMATETRLREDMKGHLEKLSEALQWACRLILRKSVLEKVSYGPASFPVPGKWQFFEVPERLQDRSQGRHKRFQGGDQGRFGRSQGG